ncbi:surfactant protein B [Oesophagostomum dentatum]|uniref:Surfactant protein B n=1 Tax=Oesophagostomum dentatum TaxID=61180 RepID=A0A0B1TH04_OESDE|nr:surfactant protein B [Oesophagostomum dentatum]
MKLILVLAVVLGCAVLSQAQVENWEIPLCKICTDWVGELTKLLDKGEQYAQEYATKFCKEKVPIEFLQNACIKGIMDTYAKIIQQIKAEISPEKVCKAIKICK